jgi:hypothetical protein
MAERGIGFVDDNTVALVQMVCRYGKKWSKISDKRNFGNKGSALMVNLFDS